MNESLGGADAGTFHKPRIMNRDAIASKISATQYRMLIGSEWRGAQSGETLDVVDPATGVSIARVPAGDQADVAMAVRAARAAFEQGAWSRMPARDRGRIMNRIADLIESHESEFFAIEILNNGFPRNFGIGMVGFAAGAFRYYAGWCDKIGGGTADLSSGDVEYHAYITKEPIGVAALIVPWNSPLASASLKMASALAAGCACVLKPAEETPLSSLLLGALILEAGVPAGVVNIVTGLGHTAGAALASHPDVDKISFTGSTEVGRLIVAATAGNLKKVSLELGGKSPVIVLDDADLGRAALGVAMGTFINSGQICVAGSRVYAHRKIYPDLLAAMAEFSKTLKLGTGFDETASIGPLISRKQLDRVTGLVERALGDSAQAVVGGRAAGGGGFFYPPTILSGAKFRSEIATQEIFGPVLTVTPFDDLDEALALANDTEYGLAAAVWSQNISSAHRLAKRLRAGTVWVNCQMVLSPEMPFGGFKQSGWGRENGFEGLSEFLQTKSTIVRL